MPYSPPAGNAVNFNFIGTYVPPFGNYVPFNFGTAPPPPPPPPPGSVQLPTALRQARMAEDDWFFMPRRQFAPVVQAVAGPIGLKHLGPDWTMFDEEEWQPRLRNIIFAPPKSRSKRPVLFTVC